MASQEPYVHPHPEIGPRAGLNIVLKQTVRKKAEEAASLPGCEILVENGIAGQWFPLRTSYGSQGSQGSQCTAPRPTELQTIYRGILSCNLGEEIRWVHHP